MRVLLLLMASWSVASGASAKCIEAPNAIYSADCHFEGDWEVTQKITVQPGVDIHVLGNVTINSALVVFASDDKGVFGQIRSDGKVRILAQRAVLELQYPGFGYQDMAPFFGTTAGVEGMFTEIRLTETQDSCVSVFAEQKNEATGIYIDFTPDQSLCQPNHAARNVAIVISVFIGVSVIAILVYRWKRFRRNVALSTPVALDDEF